MGRTLSEKLDFIPNDIVSLKDYERYAKKIMDSNSLAYVCSGAGDEITFRRNEEAFSNIFLETNTLEDLKGANTKIELFGQTYESPIFLYDLILFVFHSYSLSINYHHTYHSHLYYLFP